MRAWLGALILAVTASGPARGQVDLADRADLRVVSWNVWGLPVADRPARMARIGPALAGLAPDVVVLQEVWLAADADRLLDALRAAGLGHDHRAHARPLGGGLALASRFPITELRFVPFRLGGAPHEVWRGDYWGGKGVALATLLTPAGPVVVATTHLHARYGDEAVVPRQVAQALEAAEAVGALGLAAHDPAAEALRPPLVLAGDVNARRGEPPFEVLVAGADLALPDLAAAGGDLGIDWAFVRDGGPRDGRVLRATARARKALGGEHDLGDGRRGRLSDHDAVVVDVALRREPAARAGAGRPGPGAPGDPRVTARRATAWAAARAAAAPGVRAALDEAQEAAGEAGRAAAFWFGLSLALLALARRLRGRAGCGLLAASFALLHLAGFRAYEALIWRRHEAEELARALAALG